MVVQKFGGTSVADPQAIRRLIDIARRARDRDGRGPVVVVSAMSGVTDALLQIAASAGARQPPAARGGGSPRGPRRPPKRLRRRPWTPLRRWPGRPTN